MKNYRLKPNLTKQRIQLCFPIHRIIECEVAESYLFEGMNLKLDVQETNAILVLAYFEEKYNVVGIVPKGMMPHLEDVVDNQGDFCVQLDQISCNQLEGKMWIRIDELSRLEALPI